MTAIIKKFIAGNQFLFMIFLTGAVSLILEVLATRILTIYFGNTVFTVSGVVSVILFALSAGYFTGGRLADKNAGGFLFYMIILFSGFSVFLLYLLKLFFLPEISYKLSLQYGTIITSLLLFFIPGFLLGMLTPIVAKLQKDSSRNDGIGKITGDVFFWSTLGSILGSLSCGFILIPSFGINQILTGTAIFLIVTGILGAFFNRTL